MRLWILLIIAATISGLSSAEEGEDLVSKPSLHPIAKDPQAAKRALLHRIRLQLENDAMNVPRIAEAIGITTACTERHLVKTCKGYAIAPYKYFQAKDAETPVFLLLARQAGSASPKAEYSVVFKEMNSSDIENCILAEDFISEFQLNGWEFKKTSANARLDYAGTLVLESLNSTDRQGHVVRLTTNLTAGMCSGALSIIVEE